MHLISMLLLTSAFICPFYSTVKFLVFYNEDFMAEWLRDRLGNRDFMGLIPLQEFFFIASWVLTLVHRARLVSLSLKKTRFSNATK